jgi:hypothetical protein
MLPNFGNNLFPGVTAVTLVLIAVVLSLWLPNNRAPHVWSRASVRGPLALVVVLSLVGVAITLAVGRWSVTIGDLVLFRMSNLNRALALLILCGVPLIYLTPRARSGIRRRSPLLFYAAMTVVLAVLACGPVLRGGHDVLVERAPYWFLMHLPGFNQLRILTRFWVLGTLTLAAAAGMAFASFRLRSGGPRAAAVVAVAAGLMLDSWLRGLPMAEPPELWQAVEPPGEQRPILELPLGPRWDAAATFRSMAHRRRVVNGVSGFDPAHYAPLQAGLNDHDPAMIEALASFGSFDVIVNEAEDPTREWTRYVTAVRGVTRIGGDGIRSAYRVPAFVPPAALVGDPVPIARVDAFRHDTRTMIDGRIETEWGDNPQRPAQWVRIDLGSVAVVGGLTHGLGEYARDFPRHLVIELSVDAVTWERVWEGSTAAMAFRAAALSPREAGLRFAFPPTRARFVQLRQVAKHLNMWRIAELQVHAPPDR